MKVGDFVQHYGVGPLLQVVELIENGAKAVVRNLKTGMISTVLVVALVFASIGVGIAHGHGPDDPPTEPVAGKVVESPPIAASGAMAFGRPRVLVVGSNPADELLAAQHRGRVVIKSGGVQRFQLVTPA
jgi:ABC-type Na+ efflux pump permease subunit